MSEWREIPEYSGLYWVSDDGRVRNRKGIILKGAKGKSGYLHVVLSKYNTPKTLDIHRLVAITFVHNKDNKGYVNHKDGNKHNNRVENLEWVSARENTYHATIFGLKNDLGSNSSNSKLTENQVLEIRLLANSLTNKEIAERYSISEQYVPLLLNYKRWGHLQFTA